MPGGPGGGVALPFVQERVGRDNGQAEKLNQMMEAIQQDRSRLLNTANVPHHYQQQRMGGWNPIETVKVERPGLGNQVQQQLDALQQQRNQIQVPMRQF
jgi:predicted component of type VI protein secretion system